MKKVESDSDTFGWQDFARALPWVTGAACFGSAYYGVRADLFSTLFWCALLLGSVSILYKRPRLLLTVLIGLAALLSGVVSQTMEILGFSREIPWGISLWVPGMSILQQSGVGHLPVVAEFGRMIYHLLAFLGGYSEQLPSSGGLTFMMAGLATLLYLGVKEIGFYKLALVAMLVPLYEGVFYKLNVIDSLSMFFVYGVVVGYQTKTWQKTEENAFSGLGVMLLAMVLVGVALGVHTLLPFEKLDRTVQKWLPDWLPSRNEEPVEARKNFTLKQTSYYPLKTRLGGPIKGFGSGVVFKINATKAPLYLRGTVYNHYDGKNWSWKSKGQMAYDSAYGRTGKATGVLPKGELVERMDLEEVDFHSDVIFSPLGFWEIATDKTLLVETRVGATYRYQRQWYQKPLTSYSVMFTGKDQQLGDRASNLELPKLPELKRLAENVTTGSKNDLEKIERIQSYLKQNYRYALDVPIPPVQKDFAQYFLFEDKKGYCTYFATATTLLARASGIPARYVEGYLLSPLKYSKGSYYVTEDLAHAWTEVYIKEEGWVTVESTPGYDFGLDLKNPVTLKNPSISEQERAALPEEEKAPASKLQAKGTSGFAAWTVLMYLILFGFIFAGMQRLMLEAIKYWLYFDLSRQGSLKRIYYMEYLLERHFGIWDEQLGVHQKMSRYFLVETDAALLGFDDIIKTTECVLYGLDLPAHSELERLSDFVRCFENHYVPKTTRIFTMLTFLKGWKTVGANRKNTTP